MAPFLYIIGGVVVGAVIGFLLARVLRKEDGTLQVKNDALMQDVTRLYALTETKEQEVRHALEKAAKLEAEKEGIEGRVIEQKQSIIKLQESMETKFENLANKIFSEKANEFSQKSTKDLGVILDPLKKDLEEFRKKVDDSFGTQGKEQASLKTQIELIAKTGDAMRLQADSLTKALKGDVKAQGNWGEVILKRLLEESGLREGVEYTLQGIELGLKNEEGRIQRPDVIINLPEGKHIIIDSKVSLLHYEQYCAETDDQKKPFYLKQFTDSLKRHIDGLSGKGYQYHENLNTPDIVIMFLPIEGSFSLALQFDPQLFNYAWQRKITIAHPSTLFAMLRVVESIWKVDAQNKNWLKIAQVGGALHDKVVGFVEDMLKIGSQIDKTKETYDEAFKKLKIGKGNAANLANNLRLLGAKTKKKLPDDLLEEAIAELEALDA